MAAAAAAAAKKQFYEQNCDQQQMMYQIDNLALDNDQEDDDDDDNQGNIDEQQDDSERKLVSIDRDFVQKAKKDETENSLINPFSPFQQRSTFDSTQPSQCSGNTRLFPNSAQEKRRISNSETGDLISSNYFPFDTKQNAQLQIKGALLNKTLKHITRINQNTLKSSAFNSILKIAQFNRLRMEHLNRLQEANIENMQLKCKLKDCEKSIIELAGKFQGAQQGYLRKKDELKVAVDQRQRIKKISVQVAKKSYQVEDELKEMREQNQKYRLKVSATIKWVAMSQSLRIVNSKLKMLQFKKQYENADNILEFKSS